MTLLRILVAVFAAAAISSAASAQTIGIVSTGPGSYTHSASSAIAKLLVERAGLQARVQPQIASPSINVEAGTGELGLTNSFDSVFFITGTGDYEGQGPRPNLRALGNIVPLTTAMHARKDGDIKSIADIKGKRLGGGFTAQKTIARIIEAHLANAGLTYDDVRQVLAPNVGAAADDFGAGKSDAFFFALGSAKVKEVAAKVGGIRAIPINPDPAAIARAEKILPGAYALKIQPAPNFDGVEQEMNIIAFDFILNTNNKVSDDVIYKITKVLYDHGKEMGTTFPPLRAFDPAKMVKSYPPLEYHPGAIKFFKEKGMWPPKQS
jgi:TRAP transporter TAXI family solute receptor